VPPPAPGTVLPGGTASNRCRHAGGSSGFARTFAITSQRNSSIRAETQLSLRPKCLAIWTISQPFDSIGPILRAIARALGDNSSQRIHGSSSVVEGRSAGGVVGTLLSLLSVLRAEVVGQREAEALIQPGAEEDAGPRLELLDGEDPGLADEVRERLVVVGRLEVGSCAVAAPERLGGAGAERVPEDGTAELLDVGDGLPVRDDVELGGEHPGVAHRGSPSR